MRGLPNLSRRSFLTASAGIVTGVASGMAASLASRRSASAHDTRSRATAASLPAGLFALGVCSGDPLPDGVVLWTRLAPPAGLPQQSVSVNFEVAQDERFSSISQRGTASADPAWGHSLHIEVDGLQPDREYFYRFRVGDETSPVGRTRTAPATNEQLSRLRFAIASCQNWQDGYFTAYQHLVNEDIRFLAFLGDYLYESAPRDTTVRKHEGAGEPRTLAEYRNRYAQYHTDPDLLAARAAVPWIVTWDDHEVDNNYAALIPQDPDQQSPSAFAARRRAAFQAYYEHMPLRASSLPSGGGMRLHRRLHFGQLATLHVLDTRQYRSDQPSTLAEANDPAATMLGVEQERWLSEGLRGSSRRWNLLANQVMWASNDRKAGPEQEFEFDNWDGYRAQRRRMLELFGTIPERNPVVLTGDRHATWVCDLRPDFDDPASPVVGAEITGTSISSGGDPDTASWHQRYDPIMAESPHWKYIDNRRGYVVCDLTEQQLHSELRIVNTVWQPTGSSVTTAASFDITAGVPGITATDHEAGRRHAAPTGPRYDVDDDQR